MGYDLGVGKQEEIVEEESARCHCWVSLSRGGEGGDRKFRV
jgi:hypothetical protein